MCWESMDSPSATRRAPGRSSPPYRSVARAGLETRNLPPSKVHWREILGRPVAVSLYAVSLALNIVFTRAWATHIGPGMAAALDYCMRGVGVPLAFLVSPISNSLLPEIARLRSQMRLREAFRLIDKTLGLAALAAVAGCGMALALRQPVIAILFQRGNFTAESTRLVSTVFLGLAPSLIGWSLLELTGRALFALDRPASGAGRLVHPGAGQRGLDAFVPLVATAVDRVGSVGGIDGGIPGPIRRRARQPETLVAVTCGARTRACRVPTGGDT
jgi:hypothetical protein